VRGAIDGAGIRAGVMIPGDCGDVGGHDDVGDNHAGQAGGRCLAGGCCGPAASAASLLAVPAPMALPRPDAGGAGMRLPHRRAKAAPRMDADGEAAWFGPPPLADRSCCCPARPVVRVLLPGTSARSHPVDLLLCGHHYLASRGALAAANAVAIDETGAVLDSTSASADTANLTCAGIAWGD